MRARARAAGPGAEQEPPASLRPLYDARRARSVAAVRTVIATLAAADHRVTLAAIERVSRDLTEGAVSAKTVLRNPECRALYVAATSKAGAVRISRSAPRALRAELSGAASTEANIAPAAPSTAEVRRVRRLDRRSKRELATLVIRLEREVEALHRHNAERFLLSGAAHGTGVLGAHVWGRAGEQKTDWTKPRPRARYGDCMAQPSDRNRCELVRRARAGAGSGGTG